MTTLKTHHAYVEQVAQVAPWLKVHGRYVDGSVAIPHICICGEEWIVMPRKILNKNSAKKCPECSKRDRSKRNGAVFLKKMKEVCGDRYRLLSDYIDSQTKVKVRHTDCGYIWMSTPNNLLKIKKCPSCSGNIKKSQEEFEKEVFDTVGKEYTVLGLYVNNKTKVKMRHEKCGRIWSVEPKAFMNGNRCFDCGNNLIRENLVKHHEVYIIEVHRINPNTVVIDEYINARTKIKHRCECGEVWMVRPDEVLKGGHGRCPLCSSSKGERKIYHVLNNTGVNCDREVVFDGCKHERLLPFDFYLNRNLLIEFDGEQHFREVGSWGGKDQFNMTRLRDNIKDRYCIGNNIPLIRIPYWEFDNIEHILDSVLKYFNIIDGECEDIDIVESYYVRDEWDQDEYIAQAPCNKKGLSSV